MHAKSNLVSYSFAFIHSAKQHLTLFFLIISQAKSLGSSEPEQENTQIDNLEDQMGN